MAMTDIDLNRVPFWEASHVAFWKETVGKEGQEDKFRQSE